MPENCPKSLAVDFALLTFEYLLELPLERLSDDRLKVGFKLELCCQDQAATGLITYSPQKPQHKLCKVWIVFKSVTDTEFEPSVVKFLISCPLLAWSTVELKACLTLKACFIFFFVVIDPAINMVAQALCLTIFNLSRLSLMQKRRVNSLFRILRFNIFMCQFLVCCRLPIPYLVLYSSLVGSKQQILFFNG